MSLYSTFVLYYSVSAFGGWIIETVFRSVKSRKFVNPGFLYGPFVSIYGYAAAVVFLIDFLIPWLPFWIKCTVFCLIPSVFEYIGSAAVEKMFSIKLWDYSELPFNIKGRVCLLFSAIWAVLIMICYAFYQPFMIGIIDSIPEKTASTAGMIFTAYFVADTAASIHIFKNLSKAISVLADYDVSKLSKSTVATLTKQFVLFMRVFNAFPNIYNDLSARISTKIKRELTSRLKIAFDFTKDKEFMGYVQDILANQEFKKLGNFHHHYNSIYAHSIKVAYLSFKIGKALEKVMNIHVGQLSRGALLHDFFLYDWHKRSFPKGTNHAIEHPKIALRNSLRQFPDLTPIEKDIIAKHMWPICFHLPKYIETFIVIIVDKIIASDEFILEFIDGNQTENTDS